MTATPFRLLLLEDNAGDRARMMEKLGIKDFRELVVFAVKHGIIESP